MHTCSVVMFFLGLACCGCFQRAIIVVEGVDEELMAFIIDVAISVSLWFRLVKARTFSTSGDHVPQGSFDIGRQSDLGLCKDVDQVLKACRGTSLTPFWRSYSLQECLLDVATCE